MAEERLTFGDPHDPLTVLCEVALKSVEYSVKDLGLRMMVIIVDPSSDPERSGVGAEGYDEREPTGMMLIDLLQQTRAVAKLRGQEVLIAPLNRG